MRHRSSGDGEWTRADLEEPVRNESSTFTWLPEPIIRHAGFAIRVVRYYDDGFFARYLLTVP